MKVHDDDKTDHGVLAAFGWTSTTKGVEGEVRRMLKDVDDQVVGIDGFVDVVRDVITHGLKEGDEELADMKTVQDLCSELRQFLPKVEVLPRAADPRGENGVAATVGADAPRADGSAPNTTDASIGCLLDIVAQAIPIARRLSTAVLRLSSDLDNLTDYEPGREGNYMLRHADGAYEAFESDDLIDPALDAKKSLATCALILLLARRAVDRDIAGGAGDDGRSVGDATKPTTEEVSAPAAAGQA